MKMPKSVRRNSIRSPQEEGFILIMVILFLFCGALLGLTSIYSANMDVKISGYQVNKNRAFYLTDSSLDYVLTYMNVNPVLFKDWFIDPNHSTASGGTPAVYTTKDITEMTVTLGGQVFKPVIMGPGDGPYVVSSSGIYNGAESKLEGTYSLQSQVSTVFDYGYFINNWGWFYGTSITANGDIRSNGNFDFRGGPRVNGTITAAGHIAADGSGINGAGGNVANQFPNKPQLPMPNLYALSYYENLSKLRMGTVSYWDPAVGSYRMVNQVQGDDAGEKPNLYLSGDPTHPILISGPVVVRGDVIIKGTVKGQGTIYAGRNAYIAGNLSYANQLLDPATGTAATRPTGSPPTQAAKDQWVDYNKARDLLCVAAEQSIFLGDYTNWSSTVGNYLYNMGHEDGVGPDGVPNTADDQAPDGILQSYEDRDQDGVLDANYTVADVTTNLSNYANLPAGTTQFNQVASNGITTIEGALYCNHAVGGQVGAIKFDGAVISKDESIIFSSNFTINYDERLNSRYQVPGAASNFVNMGMPVVLVMGKLEWRILQ